MNRKGHIIAAGWFFIASQFYNPPNGGPPVLSATSTPPFSTLTACDAARLKLTAIPDNVDYDPISGWLATDCMATDDAPAAMALRRLR